MKVSGLHLALTRIEWEYFVTLTFGTGWRHMPASRIMKLVFKWLRVTAEFHGVKWENWLWVVRGEHGETTGRFHLHALLAYRGTSFVPNSKTTRFTMMHLWESSGGGMARVRAYSGELEGVGYILKGLEAWSTQGEHSGKAAPYSADGANCYEVGRFDPESCDVMLSHSVMRLLARNSTNKRRLSAREFRAKLREKLSPQASAALLQKEQSIGYGAQAHTFTGKHQAKAS